ncbi:MAG: amidohydrolase family protein [Phycisphaerales bacterium]|nr:amidohydrolase family protein [Phycisphaerales bacterium]
MMLACTIAAVLFAQPAAAAAPPEKTVLVRCGTLLAVPGEPARSNCTVVITGDRITSIIDGLDAKPAGVIIDLEIDARQLYVLPGLIDCHVHLTFQQDAEGRIRRVTETPADAALRGVTFARTTLEAGFTSVRDVGGAAEAILALRDAINRGDVVGPRVLTSAKSISVTGGHADPTNGYVGLAEPGPNDGVADGPDACRQAVRHQVKLGADLIKITATGGVLSISTAGTAQHFTDDELLALAQTSYAMGRKIAAHAHGTDGINAALKAGCDSIEHATFQDDESIRLFKSTGAYYVPTLLAGATVVENAQKPGYYHRAVVAKALQTGPAMTATFRKAHAAGVKIAFGTDAGVFDHGINAREFQLMVDAGMTPTEAIKSATIDAAKLCGQFEGKSGKGEVGSIAPGKFADLIAVSADPTKDVRMLQRVAFVIKGGEMIRHNTDK